MLLLWGLQTYYSQIEKEEGKQIFFVSHTNNMHIWGVLVTFDKITQ